MYPDCGQSFCSWHFQLLAPSNLARAPYFLLPCGSLYSQCHNYQEHAVGFLQRWLGDHQPVAYITPLGMWVDCFIGDCYNLPWLIDRLYILGFLLPMVGHHSTHTLEILGHLEAVIGHGLMLLLSIAKWRDSLDSQLLVYDGDRQAPPYLSNLLPEGTDLDPVKWLTHHMSIPAFPRRNASASSNRRSFGSKKYF
jgi:hypothetical protein